MFHFRGLEHHGLGADGGPPMSSNSRAETSQISGPDETTIVINGAEMSFLF